MKLTNRLQAAADLVPVCESVEKYVEVLTAISVCK